MNKVKEQKGCTSRKEVIDEESENSEEEEKWEESEECKNRRKEQLLLGFTIITSSPWIKILRPIRSAEILHTRLLQDIKNLSVIS